MCVWRRISHDYILKYCCTNLCPPPICCILGICVLSVFMCVRLFVVFFCSLFLFYIYYYNFYGAVWLFSVSFDYNIWLSGSRAPGFFLFCRSTISPYDDEHTKTVSECPFKFVQPFGKCVFEAGPPTIYSEWTLCGFVLSLFVLLIWKIKRKKKNRWL